MNNLNDFTKEQLVELLQKANRRRKRESRKWKKDARSCYRDAQTKPMYVIRLNSVYLERLYVQQEADTDERKVAVFDRLMESFTDYLGSQPKDNAAFNVHFNGESWWANTWSFDLTVDAGGDASLAVIQDVKGNELRRLRL